MIDTKHVSTKKVNPTWLQVWQFVFKRIRKNWKKDRTIENVELLIGWFVKFPSSPKQFGPTKYKGEFTQLRKKNHPTKI